MTILIPATTANLGPGFDALGLALCLYNTISWEEGDLGETLYDDAFRYYYEVHKKQAPRVRLHFDGEIPVSRGLGSSAACIVGGLMAAWALDGCPGKKEDLLPLANAMEGHPDNVAPCLLGGLISATEVEGEVVVARLPMDEGWKIHLAVPDFRLSTEKARGVLPEKVPLTDAAKNIGAMPLLLHALARGDEKLLRLGIEDALVTPHRLGLIDEAEILRDALSDYAFAISGAGPTLLFLGREDIDEHRWEAVKKNLHHDWNLLRLAVDQEGARIKKEA